MAIRTVLLALLAAAAAACAAPRIPAAVVDEHHEAWPAWEELRAAGRLPRGAALVHLDAHADFGTPELPEPFGDPPPLSVVRTLAERELAVSDFIVPAILSGVVGEFLWVTPPWLGGRFGAAPDDGIVRVEGGGRAVEVRRRILPLDRLPVPRRPWILDVDLDFFACENPHAAHDDVPIDAAEYERRFAEGEVRFVGAAEEDGGIVFSTVLKRPPGSYSWPVRLDMRVERDGGNARYVRGCICMGVYDDALPVHRPAEAEWRALVAALCRRLVGFPPPAAITISRSATSGFVPADRAAAIEAALLAELARLWPLER